MILTALKQVEQAANALTVFGEEHQKVRETLRSAVKDARKEGHTLAEIGEVLGMTRQGVYDLLNKGK